MKSKADEGLGSHDLEKGNQGVPPALPYLGPQVAPHFVDDGFILPPAAHDLDLLSPSTPAPSHTESFFSMMGCVLILGTLYLYYNQYEACE